MLKCIVLPKAVANQCHLLERDPCIGRKLLQKFAFFLTRHNQEYLQSFFLSNKYYKCDEHYNKGQCRVIIFTPAVNEYVSINPSSANSLCVGSVSYTHLDVYKRQPTSGTD